MINTLEMLIMSLGYSLASKFKMDAVLHLENVNVIFLALGELL